MRILIGKRKNMNRNLNMFTLPDPKPDSTTDKNTNPQNTFMSIGKDLIHKANLTKAQSFYLIMTIIYMAFIALMAASPTIISVILAIKGDSLEQIKPPIPLEDLIIGLFIWLGIGTIYFILYSTPELLNRWKKVIKK